MWSLFWAFLGVMLLSYLAFTALVTARVFEHIQTAHRIEYRVVRDHLIWPDVPQWNTALYELRTQTNRLINQIQDNEIFPTVADRAIKAIEESRERYIAVLETKIVTTKHRVDVKV